MNAQQHAAGPYLDPLFDWEMWTGRWWVAVPDGHDTSADLTIQYRIRPVTTSQQQAAGQDDRGDVLTVALDALQQAQGALEDIGKIDTYIDFDRKNAAIKAVDAAIDALSAQRAPQEADEKNILLRLLTDLRFALGDNGRRMQPELVEYAKELKRKADLADAQPVQRCRAKQIGMDQWECDCGGPPCEHSVEPAQPEQGRKSGVDGLITSLKDAARYLLQNGQTRQGLAVRACVTMLEDDGMAPRFHPTTPAGAQASSNEEKQP